MRGPILGSERRKYARQETSLPVTLFDSQRKALTLEPDIVDISVRGLGMQVSENLKVGDSLWFRLDLPNGPVWGKALIRWAKPHHLGYHCGVEIESLNWLQQRRLRLFLDPDAMDAVKALDWVFKAAVVALVYFVIMDYLQLPLNPMSLLGLWGHKQ